jgi:hypothetical protein
MICGLGNLPQTKRKILQKKLLFLYRGVSATSKGISKMDLHYYLWENGLNHGDFAKSIGLCPGSLSKIVHRKVTPNLFTALKIVVATKGEVTFPDLISDKHRLEIKESIVANTEDGDLEKWGVRVPPTEAESSSKLFFEGV